METLRIDLGSRLKQARLDAGLKQDQAARYLRLAVSAISAVENGQRRLDAVELFALSKLYGKPLEWFFDSQSPINPARGVRWYDADPLVRDVIGLLEKADLALRKKAAYGLLGFLSDR